MLAALKPALDSIDHLLQEGTLFDGHEHLFMLLDHSVDARSPEFWDRGCRLRSTGDEGRGGTLVPNCLQPVAGRVVSAGKAVSLLHMHERLHGTPPASGAVTGLSATSSLSKTYVFHATGSLPVFSFLAEIPVSSPENHLT